VRLGEQEHAARRHHSFSRLNPSDAEVEALKKEIDEDDSGDIDFKEFCELMNSTTLRLVNPITLIPY
jgi:Ca2+-binding EF-hand superfamily protein